MVPRLIARIAAILPVAALLSVACEHNPAEPGALASIAVTRASETLPISASVQFTATGYDANGRVVGISPTWSVAAGGGTIATSGVFSAGTTPGTFANTVTATVGSLSGTASVTVIAGPVATITLTPTPVTLATNTSQQFTAVGADVAGNVVPITPNWSVAGSAGSITSAGLFTSGMAPGTYTNSVAASVGSIVATATVTVTASALATVTVAPNPASLAIGATQQFTATGRDGAGNVISPLTFTWAVGSAAAGTISSAGLFTAGTAAGTYSNTVAATAGTITGNATVTVIAGAPATITVTPDPVTLAAGGTQQFTAVVRDASSNILPITPNWSVAAGGGTISSTGLFTAGALAGTFTNTARASVGSVNGSATVTVGVGALATITVSPNPQVLAIGGTQQFTAVGRDANGNIVAITPTWSVVASGGAINATGLLTAGTVAGTFVNTVRACSTALCLAGSVSGFASVTVNAGALATITVTPNPVAVGTDASQQFTAVGRDASNNIIPIVPAPTWSVLPGNAGGTILSPSGVYTAPTLAGSGIDTVQATSGSIVGSARVNVNPSGALVSIAITPNPAAVGASGTQQFTATGFDATGLIVPTPGLTWSVVPSMSAAGTINSSSGLFTAGILDGTYSNAVKAVSGSISGFATVVVSPLSLVDFGAAAPNGIMAGTAVTCIANGLISADVSVSPGNTITGFGPCLITGVLHLADAVALTAQNDLTAAYNTLMGLPCPPANAIVADLGGTTLAAGVYCTAIGIGVTGTVTLDGGGDPNANFVFQAGSSLVTAGNVVLINGAQAKNVYWVAGSSVTLGTGSQWKGNVVALSSITLVDTANLVGRALARNGAVTLGTGNTITLP
jgi:hypothetical protein